MKLIATKAKRMGTPRAVGDKFDANPTYGKIWVRLGYAEVDAEDPATIAELAKKSKRRESTRVNPIQNQVKAIVETPEGEASGDGTDSGGEGKPIGAMTSKETGTSGTPDDAEEALKAARVEYEKQFGRKAFHGWDVAALQRKIAEKLADQ